MLYITRKEGEKIVVVSGEDGPSPCHYEVQILKIEEEAVRVGVEAPRDVSVYRDEVFKRIIAANRAAARSRRSRSLAKSAGSGEGSNG